MFSLFKSKKNTGNPTRISTKKNDGAPMIPFIDIFDSDKFQNSILPMPSRIDKIINGGLSITMLPNKVVSVLYNNYIYTYDYFKLYLYFYRNLIFYSKKTFKGLTKNKLDFRKIENWWENSRNLTGKIFSYSEDIGFILEFYLDAFVLYKKTNDIKKALKKYCKDMIDFNEKRIKENLIKIQYKGKIKEKQMYKTKKEHHYPDIILFDIEDSKSNKTKKKAFIPIMVYDDLLECFLYNDMLLDKMEEEKENVEIRKRKEKELKDKLKDLDLEENDLNRIINGKNNEKIKKLSVIINFETLMKNNIIIKLSKEDFSKLPKNPEKEIKKITLKKILEY